MAFSSYSVTIRTFKQNIFFGTKSDTKERWACLTCSLIRNVDIFRTSFSARFAVLPITSRWQEEENSRAKPSSKTWVFVFFFQMHLHYIEEGKVPPESNGPVDPVTTEHTASSPAPATGQTASGKDTGKILKMRLKNEPKIWTYCWTNQKGPKVMRQSNDPKSNS